MFELLSALRTDQRGSTAVEYGLILALMFLAIIGSVSAFAGEVIEMWTDVDSRVDTATSNGAPAAD